MSQLNPNAKAWTPKGGAQPKPNIPKAPPVSNTVSKVAAANTRLNTADASGSHNRSQHVGMTGNQLAARGKQTATSFLSKHDQNKAAASVCSGREGAAVKSFWRRRK